MSVTTLSGLVDDQDILQNERVVDMDDVIAMLDPDVSQFTTMLMRVGRGNAFSTKVEWLEDQLFPRLSAVVSGGATDEATITVTSGQGPYFRAGDIVRNAKTGVAVRIVSVSGDVLTPSAAIGRVAFAAHTAGDQLVIVGNASAQGATLPARQMTKTVAQYNYTQIFRHSYGFTRSLIASKLYGGPQPNRERKKKAIEHKRAIEYALFWGARTLDTSGSEPVGAMGGLFEFVTSNVNNSVGTLTSALLNGYMQDFLQHGTTDVVLFVSPTVSAAISGFLLNVWQPTTVDQRLFGAKVDGFISGAYGFKVPVVVKRDWNDFSTASNQYGGWAFLVDMSNIELATLRGTQLLRDRQANDADTVDEEYLSELSVRIKQELTHGYITGVTG